VSYVSQCYRVGRFKQEKLAEDITSAVVSKSQWWQRSADECAAYEVCGDGKRQQQCCSDRTQVA
jgi:hypothetical protein